MCDTHFQSITIISMILEDFFAPKLFNHSVTVLPVHNGFDPSIWWIDGYFSLHKAVCVHLCLSSTMHHYQLPYQKHVRICLKKTAQMYLRVLSLYAHRNIFFELFQRPLKMKYSHTLQCPSMYYISNLNGKGKTMGIAVDIDSN